MNNTQIYPFERNRYYPKKRLSSADYTAEQAYFNNKRRFLNGLMYGSGIVCGLGVFSLDDLSLLVESGVAIDGMGREIVVDSSDVKKLSAISGFDSLRTNQASLCLRYKEEPVHKVYAIDSSDPEQEFQYNRVRESYELFLMDTESIPEVYSMDSEFLTKGTLMTSDHYQIEYMMPATVSRGRLVKAVLKVTKLSNAEVRMSYHGILQIPVFTAADGTNEIAVDIEDIKLKEGESVSFDYWMQTMDTSAIETNIILKTGSAAAYENGKVIPVPVNFAIKVLISNLKPREIVNREIGRLNLEMKNLGGQEEFIRLADLRLVRTDSAYIIEEIDETYAKHYITAPIQEMQRSDYLEYFVKEVSLAEKTEIVAAQSSEPHVYTDSYGNAPEIATGILEIPLGENARKGDIRYSSEIVHGLGKGNVYVEVGYEYLIDDEAIGVNAKNTIYGNPEIFADDQRTVVDAETAVRVLNDKGSFVVGAKLLRNIDYLVLNYRWVAIKFPVGNDLDLAEDHSGQSISPETPTVRMGTKENHYFGVRYNNMDKVSVTYELTEAGSGEITSDGIYTAPSKPGVYEIRIYCTDMPMICTYAYAIVKKKGFEELEKEPDDKASQNMLSGMLK